MRMRHFIEIVSTEPDKDFMGFAKQGESVLAAVRAFKESRHFSNAWRNRAAFSTATALFRFRTIPGLTVTTAMQICCDGERYKITSVENVRERGLYLECLVEKVDPSKG